MLMYRHEWKIVISYSDLLILRQRLRAVAKTDPHVIDGNTYFLRSLYFDSLKDKALREKIDGVNYREKFRLRLYNGDTSYIKLEKKSKINGLCAKDSEVITADETELLLNGDYSWMCENSRPLIAELYSKMLSQGLKPKTIIDYTREPFIFPAGNVRITLDYNIRTSLNKTDFLNPECVTVPVNNSPILLEVKWDNFLPDIIRDAVQLDGRSAAAFSKYAQSRIYG